MEVYKYIFQNNTGMKKIIVDVLNMMYKEGRVAQKWQLSQTAQLDKNNGKQGTKSVRLINMLCPVGKAFFKILWTKKARTKQVDFAYGFTLEDEGSKQYWFKMLSRGVFARQQQWT